MPSVFWSKSTPLKGHKIAYALRVLQQKGLHKEPARSQMLCVFCSSSPTSRASLSSQRAPKAPAGWVSWPSCGGRHDLAQDYDTLHGGLPFRLLAWKIKNRSRISSCRGRHSVTLGHATLSQSGQVPAPGYTDQDLWRSASEPSILFIFVFENVVAVFECVLDLFLKNIVCFCFD